MSDRINANYTLLRVADPGFVVLYDCHKVFNQGIFLDISCMYFSTILALSLPV